MKISQIGFTIFFIIGIITIIGLIYFSIDSGLAGAYMQVAIIPILLLLIIDRICVWKFGAKKVNKTQLYILCGLISLFVINWIRLQLSK